MKAVKHHKAVAIAAAGILFVFGDLWATPVLDTLEDIGPDGTAVTSRTIDGVIVTISTAASIPLEARTYFDPSIYNAFLGADGSNAPLNPENVSGTRFISTVNRNVGDIHPFEVIAPIIFDFSDAVSLFGLTTIDLLEPDNSNYSISLEAYDSYGDLIAVQTRIGPQGPSGVDLDWLVQSQTANIWQVRLSGTIIGSGGYGIDDLLVEVPEPATLALFGVGLLGLGFARRRVVIGEA